MNNGFIWTALEEAAHEAVLLGIDRDPVQCFIGLARRGPFVSGDLDRNAGDFMAMIKTHKGHSKLLKGAMIGIVFYLEKLKRETDHQAICGGSSCRYCSIRKNIFGLLDEIRRNRREYRMDNEGLDLLRFALEITKANFRLNLNDWVGRMEQIFCRHYNQLLLQFIPEFERNAWGRDLGMPEE